MKNWLSSIAFIALLLVPSLFAGGKAAPETQADVLRQIHLTNQTEIKAGNLAKQKGTTQEVRDYGQRLIQDHTKADEKVQAVAKRENVNLSAANAKIDAEMRSKENSLLEKLNRKSGIEFDNEFAEEMADAHEDTIESLKNARNRFPGSPTAKLIDELLPTLTQHEHMAERIDDKL